MNIFIFFYVLCCFLQLTFLIVEKQGKIKLSLLYKGLASLSFILLGIVAMQKSQNLLFAACIVTGLIFDGIGDVVINLRFAFEKSKHTTFLLGTALFFIGHIFYLVALLKTASLFLPSIICGIIGAAITLIILNLVLDELKITYKIFAVFYITALFLMTSIAIFNLISSPKSLYCLLFAIGAVLFATSDILLILNNFGKKKIYTIRVLNLVFYYIAQLLIATSLAFVLSSSAL